jgi:sialic acid synthase SpsE
MLKREFQIAGKRVGGGAPVYVIAEAGSNHDQSLDKARRLIDVAAQAKCDAVKFQLFDSDALYSRDHPNYALFKSVELSPDWLAPLKTHVESHGLAFFASVFDHRSADRMEAVGVPAYKIASSETTKLDLLAHIAAKGKPLLLSTGMCDLVDVMEAVACCDRNGNDAVALMQCTAVYPVQPGDANLAVMDVFRSYFKCPVGYSDHVLGTTIAVAAAARNADVIEKHITLDRTSPGPDHFYAIEPQELVEMVRQLREVEAAIGNGIKDLHPEERRLGRRYGLYAARDIAAGERIVADAIAVRQPAVGIRARHRDHVIELVSRRRIPANEPIYWEYLSVPSEV